MSADPAPIALETYGLVLLRRTADKPLRLVGPSGPA